MKLISSNTRGLREFSNGMTVLRELRVVRHYLEGWSLWSAHLVATLISTSIAVVSYVFLLFFFFMAWLEVNSIFFERI